MTAPYKAETRLEGDNTQWADYGVNVGHAMYGDIHIHPPALPADGPPRFRPQVASAISATRHTAARSALIAMVRACERTAEVLAVVSRPDMTGKEKR
ncbi:hypothetical protein AB0I84_43170 [Streptomyces spectabilis]|uniref:hypothetical protein n=1 Tax=Streptomyces spectabilis TaxID=68270 RepID=UPI0033FA9F3F